MASGRSSVPRSDENTPPAYPTPRPPDYVNPRYLATPYSPISPRSGLPVNPFQPRDMQQQPWSFDGLNESLQTASLQPVSSRHLPTAPPGPSRHGLAPQFFSPYGSLPMPGPNPTSWHNPIGRGLDHVPPPITPEPTIVEPPYNASRTVPIPTAGPSRPQINYPLGTREEVLADDYVSPLASMYGRAWTRYAEAEQRREAERVSNSNPILPHHVEVPDLTSLLGTRPPDDPDVAQQVSDMVTIRRREELIRYQDRLARIARAQEALESAREALRNPLSDPAVNPIDLQDSRPPPLTTEEMTMSVECRVCQEQKVDTLLEPCMHVAICHWCYEVMRTRSRQARIDPSIGDPRLKCPMCRRRVTQARKIFLAV